MKTKKMWDEAKCDFTKFCQSGDVINLEIYDYFLGVVPPVMRGYNYFMMGEPMSFNDRGKETYMTFRHVMETSGKHVYSYEGVRSIEEVNKFL